MNHDRFKLVARLPRRPPAGHGRRVIGRPATSVGTPTRPSTTLNLPCPSRSRPIARRALLLGGIVLAAAAVLFTVLQRRDDGRPVGGNFAACAKLEGDAARACYSREVGRELASVGGAAPATSRSALPAGQQRGDVHRRPTSTAQPLLCDLHARVGVIDEQVPSWLGWTEPLVAHVMNRRALLAGLGTVVVLVAVGVGRAVRDRRRRRRRRAARRATRPPRRSRPPATSTTCAGLVQDEGRSCYSRELEKIVNDAADPLAAVEGITSAAYADQTGFLLANCHGIMHTVAREYALRTKLTLAKLMDNLPRTNDPGCSAGYAHGLVTAVAPEIEARRPDRGQPALRRVRDALPALQLHARLRARVHAAQQRRDRSPSLQMCEQLGSRRRARLLPGRLPRLLVRGERASTPRASPRTPSPSRASCAARSRGVRARLLVPRVRRDRARGTRDVESAADVERLCGGLEGLQRQACVTGAIVIGPPDPRNQLAVCDSLAAPTPTSRPASAARRSRTSSTIRTTCRSS